MHIQNYHNTNYSIIVKQNDNLLCVFLSFLQFFPKGQIYPNEKKNENKHQQRYYSYTPYHYLLLIST